MQRKNGIVSFNPDQVEPCSPKQDELLHPILGTFSLKTTDMRFAFFCNSQFICIQLYGHESIIWMLTGFKLRMELELFPQWNEGALSERKHPWVFRPRLLVPFFVPFNPFNFQAPRFVIDRPDTTGTFILENPYVKARWRDSNLSLNVSFHLCLNCNWKIWMLFTKEKVCSYRPLNPGFGSIQPTTRLMQAASWTSPLALKVPLLMSWWGWWVDFAIEISVILLLAVGWRFHESAPYHLASWAEWARHYAGQGARVVKIQQDVAERNGLWDMIDLAYYRTNPKVCFWMFLITAGKGLFSQLFYLLQGRLRGALNSTRSMEMVLHLVI